MQRSGWKQEALASLEKHCEDLQRCAEKFKQDAHAEMAKELLSTFSAIKESRGRVTSETIERMHKITVRLSQEGLTLEAGLAKPVARKETASSVKKPIYIGLKDLTAASNLAQQLDLFGLNAQIFTNHFAISDAIRNRPPAAIVLDVDFDGEKRGIAVSAELKERGLDLPPIIFFGPEETDTETRLMAIRAGGKDFISHSINPAKLLSRVERFSSVAQHEPYKVMIIDDSRAQSIFTQRALNDAGIITMIQNQPLMTMGSLAEFQPDLILLDMYMPDCNGVELAKVIRQNERYMSVPIIFLSAEEDLDKQLDAMSEGGDDFITKPIQPRHLVATVKHRIARATLLKSKMVRDSLTGLFNHSHSLQLLTDSILRAHRSKSVTAFAMIDIDHFKRVNDTYGHPVGDKVIKGLSIFLKQRLRKTDYIGRYGGEEFAIILPDTNAVTAAKVIEEIREGFAAISFTTDNDLLKCTFSAGICESNGSIDATEVSKRADEALYVAKRDGRNRVSIHESCHPRPSVTLTEVI